MSGQRTRLQITRKTLDEEFGHLGGAHGLVESIREGVSYIQGRIMDADSPLLESGTWLHKLWKSEVRPSSYPELTDDPPPYLPHLAILCAAWSVDDDTLDGHEFYNRLLLLYPNHGLTSQNLGQWKPLWAELESWTENLNGKRGIWKHECIGHANVGIPRSQVLLTPCIIEKLHILFHLTGLDALAESKTPNSGLLRSSLLAKESYTRSALGHFLTDEIKKQSQTGIAILERIMDFLSDETFLAISPEKADTRANNGATAQKNTIQLRTILNQHSRGTWECNIGVIGAGELPSSFSGVNWKLKKKSVTPAPGGLYVIEKDDRPLSATDLGPSFFTGFKKTVFDLNNDRAELHLDSGPIKLFSEWRGSRLIESDSLPHSGGGYILVSVSIKSEAENWLHKFEQIGGTVDDYTMSGLPAGSTLKYLNKLELCSGELLEKFPAKLKPRVRKRLVSFVGGSRVQSGSNQPSYLRYDPPDILVQSDRSFSLNVTGGTIHEKDEAYEALDTLPGVHSREYEIEVESNVSALTVQVVVEEEQSPSNFLIFTIAPDQLDFFSQREDSTIEFDQFGEIAVDPGIRGAKLLTQTTTKPCDWSGSAFNIEGDLIQTIETDLPIWNLLESLSTKKRLSGREFKGKAARIVGLWEDYSWADLRALRALGHIEVERDKRGRIAYIYPNRPHSYLLPWMNNENYIAVATGCISRNQLDRLIMFCDEMGCKISLTPSNRTLIPPRITIESPDLEYIELALEEAQIEASSLSGKTPASWNIANWAPSLDDWLSQLNWVNESPPEPDQIFSPYLLRMSSPESFHCPYKLHTMEDSFSPVNKWHILQWNNFGEPSYTFLTDPSWGKWKSVYAITSGLHGLIEFDHEFDSDRTPIPYDSTTHKLWIPASLRLPSMLSRSLHMSSGSAPRTVFNVSYFNHKSSKFLPRDSPPYTGACHVYSNVPKDIAELVCSKLKAWPVDVSNTPAFLTK